ncbi:MAG: hypothetical protein QG599_2880 [Pseudomonadota bacterium]|nr:hypothetical protein [Pseudomonadota bacterium]
MLTVQKANPPDHRQQPLHKFYYIAFPGESRISGFPSLAKEGWRVSAGVVREVR